MADRSPPAPPSYLLEARYLAERHVARGETADVFAGTDTYSGEHIAVRRLRADRPERAAPFRRMAERLFGTTSARLLRAIAMGEDREGLPILITELLVGRDVQRLGQVRWEVACEITRQCAVAIAEMHVLGLHHGDLRPSTFFVGASTAGGSRVKLLDLGTGDRTATAEKDVRGLVAILHRLLLGTPPLPANARGPLRLSVTGVPPSLEQSLSQWLAADEADLAADAMAAELLEIRNASHGDFWSGASGARSMPAPPPDQVFAKISVNPRSSVLILDGTDEGSGPKDGSGL